MAKMSTILIADDDRGMVEAITIRLHAAGHHVVSCMDGEDALSLARGIRPDVIVLDVNMPAGSGQDVHEQLQMFGELGDTPVVYITGASRDEIDQLKTRVNPFAVLRKPFDAMELLETIADAIEAFPQII